jgi:hypothetical protein
LQRFLADGLKAQQSGLTMDLKQRINPTLRLVITQRIKVASGYSHIDEDAWTAWTFQEFYDFFMTGKGSQGFKDPTPRERIEAIPFESFDHKKFFTTDKLAEAMGSVATDYSDFFSANADELAAAVGHLFTHLKECQKKNHRLKLVYSKIKEGGRIESVEEFIGRFYDLCFEGV